MKIFLYVGLPILLIVLFYVTVRYLNFDETKKIVFVKFRIFAGCIGVGVFLSQAYAAETIRAGIPLILLSLLVFYGVASLQKKYF